jgi:transposase
MTIENINVEAAVKRVNELITAEKKLSPALKASLEVLLLLVSILVNRLGLNSTNSSKPPSADRFRKKEPKSPTGRKPGGQHGHVGTTLKQVPDPDVVRTIPVDRATLPPGTYHEVGFEARQVVDHDISTCVTEWRAQILVDQDGKRFTASFPDGVTRPVQYGIGVKVSAVYMSQFQLIPYNRVEDYFRDELQIPISVGSISNFNKDVFDHLLYFEQWIKKELLCQPLLHCDETGINICSKTNWLHNVSSEQFTYFYPHAKRGNEATDEMGVLAMYHGILCHDHWKPYYRYDCTHALCNAHHLRELERAFEQDGQQWAQTMALLLKEINKAVHEAGGCLEPEASQQFRIRYRELLKEAESECPHNTETDRQGKRGKIPQTKARNLLERLRDFEADVLRFMDDIHVPFSNNQAENDLRMTKVQQKISGCFRSLEGARIFCRIRSYLSTCRKQGVTASEALQLLFQGTWPKFMLTQQSAE